MNIKKKKQGQVNNAFISCNVPLDMIPKIWGHHIELYVNYILIQYGALEPRGLYSLNFKSL